MNYILEFVMAFVAIYAFAFLFCVPKKELLFSGLSGALGWVVYYGIVHHDLSPVLASLVATFILTVFSRTMAVIRSNPATVYLLCGIFPLVPGAGIYYTAYYLITGDNTRFASKGLETFEIALAIVFGIIFGFAIPEAIFHMSSRSGKSKEEKSS